MTGIASALAATAGAASGLSGVAAYLAYRLKRRGVREAAEKTMAEAAKVLTETSLALLKPVQEAAATAEQRVKTLLAKIAELESAVQSLKDSQEDLLLQLVEVTAERDRYREQSAAGGPAAAVA